MKIAKLHARIGDRRLHLHQLSKRIIGEKRTGVPRNKELACSIADAGRRRLPTLLESKAEHRGPQVAVINRWLPTSRRCSACPHRGGKKLSIRQWQSPRCGSIQDRDINAALNILAAGLAERQSGCGAVHQPTSALAAGREASTHPNLAVQRRAAWEKESLPFRTGRMSKRPLYFSAHAHAHAHVHVHVHCRPAPAVAER